MGAAQGTMGALGGAASGAALGTAFIPIPGVGTAIGAIGGGLIGGLAGLFSGNGADEQAQAAQAIAEAQAKQAEINRQQALGFAAPTANEIAGMQAELDNMNRLVSLHQAAYDRDVQIVNAFDPSIMAAGQNAYDLMTGKAAPTLKPLQDQITQQRAQLSSQLEKQLGPGYQTSSAGIQALNQFDMNANSTLSQAQQSYMGSTGNLMTQLTNARPNLNQENNQFAGTLGQLQGQYMGQAGQIQGRQVGAALGTNTTAYAGASNVAQGMLGQQQAAQGGQLLSTLGTLGTAGLMGSFGAKNPQQTTTYGTQPLNTPQFNSYGPSGVPNSVGLPAA